MITVLCGGVGGSRFMHALSLVVPQRELTAIINTADDDEIHGFHISPDPDIVTYMLGGVIDGQRGWGFNKDTFRWNQQLARFGRDTWFQIGDRDLATHLFRTDRLRAGASMSEVVDEIRLAFGVAATLLPMTDERVRTVIETEAGDMAFQRYLVKRHAADRVIGVRFDGAAAAKPAPGVIDAIREATAIFIAPSNPIGSVSPILAIPGVRAAIAETEAPVIAISPIIGGNSLQPPAAEMMSGLGYAVDSTGVERIYTGLLDMLVIDQRDEEHAATVASAGVRVVVADTIMADDEASRALAITVLQSAGVDIPA
jgi:LPPG:FO 2-phospho-L-lactate transferase